MKFSPTLTIKLPDAMRHPGVGRILDALPGAMFVGGCVRNAVLGKAVADVDLATPMTPDAVTKALKAAKIKVIPTGIDHGTVTAVADDASVEITTLRQDVETHGRRAVVAFTEDWSTDAARRDFTMNTLLCDGRGRVYDPLGSGLKDLQRGKVVFVGDPVKRIKEDYLRILRFYRFQAWYGRGKPDAAALEACRSLRKGIGTLSRERITAEMIKLILADDAPSMLDIMHRDKILPGFFRRYYSGEALADLIEKQKKHDAVSLAPRLFLVLSKTHRLILSGKIVAKIQMIDWMYQKYRSRVPNPLAFMLYYMDRQDAIDFRILEGGARTGFGSLSNDIQNLANWPVPVLPVSAKDFMARGMKPGPALGEALKKAEAKWVKSGFALGREDLL